MLKFDLLLVGLALIAVVAPASGGATVEDRVRQYGPAAAARWAPFFKQAGVMYPPQTLVFAGFKAEKTLEVYAAGTNGQLHFVRSCPVLAASGKGGPKLREGDLQVPEGLYRIESVNPNSRFHLSLRIDYPNAEDRARAKAENRTQLGGDIMIHGNAVSIGCLAMGDEAAEDLFVLAAATGISRIEVILSPVDFRRRPAPPIPAGAPAWTAERWSAIQSALGRLKKPA